jgi:hypothetical protein
LAWMRRIDLMMRTIQSTGKDDRTDPPHILGIGRTLKPTILSGLIYSEDQIRNWTRRASTETARWRSHASNTDQVPRILRTIWDFREVHLQG